MPKKRVVASVVGNFSPVKRRTAILVRRVRHLRGDMGEELNSRAVMFQYWSLQNKSRDVQVLYHLERQRYGPA
jgi:hypothetical protein